MFCHIYAQCVQPDMDRRTRHVCCHKYINSMNVGEKWSFQNSNCQCMFLVVDSVQFMDKILAHCLYSEVLYGKPDMWNNVSHQSWIIPFYWLIMHWPFSHVTVKNKAKTRVANTNRTNFNYLWCFGTEIPQSGQL